MQAFEYIRPGDVASAVALVSGDPTAQYLAGGTTQIDLMLKDGVLDHIPRPLTQADIKAFEEYKPVPIEGKPLSETIIEERR